MTLRQSKMKIEVIKSCLAGLAQRLFGKLKRSQIEQVGYYLLFINMK